MNPARRPEHLAAFYDSVLFDRGLRLPPHLRPVVAALADQRIGKLMTIIGPGSGKSLLLSVIYSVWELGIDPSQTILGISAGEALMQGFMSAAAQIIEFSPVYQQYFPRTRPDKDVGWSTDRGLFVTGHNPGDPDASYFTAGLSSKSLTGKHGRIILCDDLHDRENSSTSEACGKVASTYYDTILGRADPQGARFIVAGRRWNESDVYGHLQADGDFVTMVLPAERKGERLYWDVTVPDGLDCIFTEGRTRIQ